MGKPIIGVDLDGVIVALLDTAIRRCGIPTPISGYGDAPGYAIKSWGLSCEQVVAVTRELYNPLTVLEAEPYDGAIDAWRILERLGDLHVITARADRYRSATYQWLEKQKLAPAGIHFTQDKGRLAKAIGATIVFEDAPKHIAQYVYEGIEDIFHPSYPYCVNAPGQAYSSWKHLFGLEPLATMLEDAIRAEQAAQQSDAKATEVAA